MKKIIDYYVVTGQCGTGFENAACSLSRKIKPYIEQGWQPVGPVQTQYNYCDQDELSFAACQVVVKYEEDDNG